MSISLIRIYACSGYGKNRNCHLLRYFPKTSGCMGSSSANILAGTITSHLNQQKPATQKQSAPVAQPTREPAVQPTPSTPASRPPVEQTRLVQRPAARATLVRLPPPRAQLVRAPEWQLGQARIMRMPYDMNMEVRGVLKGYLAEVSLLPRGGNRIGDTWIVGRTPWVWITVPGTTAPTWSIRDRKRQFLTRGVRRHKPNRLVAIAFMSKSAGCKRYFLTTVGTPPKSDG
jgi:hypothetical protein